MFVLSQCHLSAMEIDRALKKRLALLLVQPQTPNNNSKRQKTTTNDDEPLLLLPPAIKGVLLPEEQRGLRASTIALFAARQCVPLVFVADDTLVRILGPAEAIRRDVLRALVVGGGAAAAATTTTLERCSIGKRCFIPILRLDLAAHHGVVVRVVLTRCALFADKEEPKEEVLDLTRDNIGRNQQQRMLCFVGSSTTMSPKVREAMQWTGDVYVHAVRCDQCKRKWANGLTRCSGCRRRHYCSRECRLADHRLHVRARTCKAPRLATIAESEDHHRGVALVDEAAELAEEGVAICDETHARV